MPDYRRVYVEGGLYFFTVNLLQRRGNDLLVRHIDSLRAAVRKVKKAHPFTIHAFVVLPEHLHCILELPTGDDDFPLRWRLIKSEFSKSLPITERRSAVRVRRGERGIWQRRFISFPSSGLGMPTLKLCLTFNHYEHKDKPVLFVDTPSGAWQ